MSYFTLPEGVTPAASNAEIVGTLVPFPTIPNVTFTGSDPRISDAVIAPLRRVAQEAEKLGYAIEVDSAYRCVAHQQAIWDVERPHYASDAEALIYVAAPGKSPHHTGGAIDIYLHDSAGKSSLHDETLAALLQQLMLAQGWTRFRYENWHFEYGTPRWSKGPGTVQE
ncbi:MAG TPA: M15 family metallopeptidase [Armatimonadota bacterium]|nr:M15 family metallopeptidase [Armatimonadota bacterium]